MFSSKGWQYLLIAVVLILAISGRGDIIVCGLILFLAGSIIKKIYLYCISEKNNK